MKTTIIISLTAVLLLGWAINLFAEWQNPYVRGRDGNHCYVRGQQNKNIKYPIYYKTLADCLRK